MDIVGIAQTANGWEMAKLQQEVGVKVLKKTLDFNNSLAMQLIQDLSQTTAINNNPSNTGQLIDIRV